MIGLLTIVKASCEATICLKLTLNTSDILSVFLVNFGQIKIIKPFLHNITFLYSLKTSENFTVS